MTGQELINKSLQALGIIAAGQSPTTTESDDALVTLNMILESLSAQGLPVYEVTRETVTMTGGSPYTLPTRPMLVKSAAYTANGVITPYAVVTNEIWSNGLQNNVVWYDAGFPTGKIYARPDPSSGTMELYSLRELSSVATLGTSLAFPPGYELALQFILAQYLITEYPVPIPIAERIVTLAADAKNSIQGLNAAVIGPPAVVETAATE